MNLEPHRFRQNSRACLLALAIIGLACICGMTSARWIGTAFPGFFVMDNRVIASVSLPHWPVALHSQLYQHQVTAIDDQPVATSAEIYAQVQQLPAGSPITYTLEKDGQVKRVTLTSLTFTFKDYLLLFGAYLFVGLAIALVGVSAWFMKPDNTASQALCLLNTVTGVFCLTGADLYGPHWFFRLHVLSEALFPAGLVHFALIFPVNRVRPDRKWTLGLPYMVSLSLTGVYEAYLYQPAVYSFVHNTCMVYAGLSGLLFAGKVTWDFVTTESLLIRQRIKVVLIGFLGGYLFPALLMLLSGLTGGALAVNYVAFTGPLFPGSLGYAVMKHDLLEIDAMVKRGTYYLSLTAALTVLYVLVLTVANLSLHSWELFRSPIFPLGFALFVAFLLNPLRNVLQRQVDRVFFGLHYDPKKTLETTSAALAATIHMGEILSLVWQTIKDTVSVETGGILLPSTDKTFYSYAHPKAEKSVRLAADHPLIQTLRADGQPLSRWELTEEVGPQEASSIRKNELHKLGVLLLVPCMVKGELIGIIALGKKSSGGYFSTDDLEFVMTLANQAALSVANASSYHEVQHLNRGLEEKVVQLVEKEQEVKQSHAQLRHLSARLLHLQEDERERISRELHDHLGQLLTAIGMDVHWTQQHTAEEEKDVRERLHETSYLVQAAIRTTRELSSSLRPASLKSLGLEDALKQHIAQFERRSNVAVHTTLSLREDKLPSETATNVYRIIQEALNNVARHAQATEVDVQVGDADDTLKASIIDNGAGFDSAKLTDPNALGLVGMQERARLIGGQLAIVSTPGSGTSVQLEIPLKERELAYDSNPPRR